MTTTKKTGLNLVRAFGFDKKKLEEGYDVDLGEGAVVRVRSARHPLSREAYLKAQKKYSTELASNDESVREAAYANMFADTLAEAAIISWTGIVDEEGNELPFSPEVARPLLLDLEDFRNLIFNNANDRARIAYDKVDTVAKN